MSPREKKLLYFFAAAGFIVVNFLLFGYAQNLSIKAKADRAQAERQLEQAEQFRDSSEQISDEMDWLAEHEPEAAANQDVQTKLQQLCESEARAVGLTIKTQKPLPTDEGTHFHRAKIQLLVNGSEESLYRWFDRLNVPDQLRVASSIRLSPNQQDDTKIDCTATIEQWFVPLPPSA